MALRATHRRAGFTLVELMIAMLAGAFAVAGVYYLNGVSSRAFSEQMRVSETQMSLRSAMEQLRRELARAGYLFTASSRVNPDCSGAYPVAEPNDLTDRAAPLSAISVVGDGSLAGVNTLLGSPATNATRADQVDVWGNYATSDAYLADPLGTTRTTIRFQADSESFRRSFFNRATNAIDTTRFTEAFAPGRMVRVESDGRVFFRGITAVSATAPNFEVTINTLPWCYEPTRWSAVAPIVHYRYGLEPDTRGDLARLRPITAGIGSARALLVRREWRWVGGADTVVANSARVILDQAIEFAADALVDANAVLPPATPNMAATPQWTLVRGANLATQSANAPWAFRSLIVTLSARSSEADPRLPTIARARFGNAALLDSPLMTFRVIGGNVPAGANLNARVRTMRSEIFLQNL